MYKRCMKGIAVVVLLISLISISSAAAPRAVPDLYSGQCGVQLSVAAPGLLTNDVSSKPLHVSAWTTPTLGTLTVNADGSFVYNPPQNIASGTYVLFYYTASDGTTSTASTLVKIAVTCVCRGAAPDVNVCPDTKITSDFLISKGAGCIGCRDATPKFDLSKIPAQPVAGQSYPYTVLCPNCALVTGHVVFQAPCTITPDNTYTVCSGVEPTPAEIQSHVTCSCGNPIVTNIVKNQAGTAWTYDVSCTSAIGCTATATGKVQIEAPCTITPDNTYTVCSGVEPTPAEIQSHVTCSCGDPKVTNIKKNAAGTAWTYDVSCTSERGCLTTATGAVQIEAPCTITPDNTYTVCSGVEPTPAEIEAHVTCSCGDPKVTNIKKNAAGTAWTYDVSCTSERGCLTTATGAVQIEAPCTITPDNTYTVCSGVEQPTPAEIEAHVTCSCGNPVVTNIKKNAAGTAWTYDVSCTSEGGCLTTATGTVNIGQPCVIDFTVFPVSECPAEINQPPTADEVIGLGGVTCGCDATPEITNIHWVSTPSTGEWTGEYTITCTSEDSCTSSTIGQFNNENCQDACTGVDCDDNNPCTDDSCVAGNCVNTNDDTNKCDDGIYCTMYDKCSKGECVGIPQDCNCGDNNDCTVDACKPGDTHADKYGCVHTNQCHT